MKRHVKKSLDTLKDWTWNLYFPRKTKYETYNYLEVHRLF